MTVKMKLVYIAGPYRPTKDKSIEQNIMAARNKALQLVLASVNDLGGEWFPMVPHLNTANFDVLIGGVPDKYYLDGTMNLMLKCDAVLLTQPDADSISSGTIAEISVAKTCNIPVFRTLEEFLSYARQPGLQSNTR